MRGAPIFVHTEPGRWGLMPLNRDLPLPVDVEDVVTELSSERDDPALVAGTRVDDPVPARSLEMTCTVGPVGPVLGVLGRGRLIVETNEGTRVGLDAGDLRLFDSIRSSGPLGPRVGPGGAEALGRRAARLVAAGLLVVQDDEPPT